MAAVGGAAATTSSSAVVAATSAAPGSSLVRPREEPEFNAEHLQQVNYTLRSHKLE